MVKGGAAKRGNSRPRTRREAPYSDYYLRDEHEGMPLEIEISDRAGQRRAPLLERGRGLRALHPRQYRTSGEPFEVEYPPIEKGANQWVWDMRRGGLHCIDDINIFEGFGGAFVPPGRYTAKVSIGDFEDTAELTLVADRRVGCERRRFRASRVESPRTYKSNQRARRRRGGDSQVARRDRGPDDGP